MEDDDFYNMAQSSTSQTSGVMPDIWQHMLSTPKELLTTLLLFSLFIIIATRLLSGRAAGKVAGKDAQNVWLLSYWFPVIGHGISFLANPVKLMSEARDQSPHGIFALNMGATTNNIILNPALVSSTMSQKESAVSFQTIAWNIVARFFGVPKRAWPKYEKNWEAFVSLFRLLMKEPDLSKAVNVVTRHLEVNISQMISFTDSDIDMQPWERWANARYVSNSETELNLMALVRDMLGHASVPAIFGSAILEKYPELLHDVYAMDFGMYYFLLGLPALTPWPGVGKAHMARYRVWEALDELQVVLDAAAEGKPVDPSWGELDDISDLIMKRNALFRENGFEIKERADISILWALVVNANLIVYWQLLYILSTPGLVSRVRAEIAPYAKVAKPFSIGSISEAPKLTLSHEELCKKCPLLKSTYLEALRLTAQPYSIRKVEEDVVISDRKDKENTSFLLQKGDFVTIPHDIHMKDPKYFSDPNKFDPDRFIVKNEDGTMGVDIKTIRPYGGGPSMCKGRVFAERECLSLVAGVLSLWDIEPAGKSGWVIPRLVKTSAVSLPQQDTRVRIKRRVIGWEN